eukprot:TRINITY_DN19256_c0_g1_i2.p1 TRINITY_DN19256_c0_g1~~TRINITY_DN19256_c0_g1_i2.p1  ORF type:complete len:678 (+),score=214.97 TRINITY_DN19256_c0_g1_i2:92-2125(+)
MGRADGPRGVAFSTKQKKAQLQERRARKAAKGTGAFGVRDEAAGPREPQSAGDGERELHTTDGVTTRGGVRQRSELRSVFARESKEEVDKRRKAAQEPLLERHFEQGVPYERWWDVSGTAPPEKLPCAIALPQRPSWQPGEAKEAVEDRERREFARWERRIARKYGTSVNLYERNLEVWRQLWRVIEFSDVIITVADARHPLFHLPASLHDLVTAKFNKPMVVLLNKIDLVSASVLQEWRAFFARAYPGLAVCQFTCYPNQDTVTAELNTAQFRLRKKRQQATKVNYNQYVMDGDNPSTANRDTSSEESTCGSEDEEGVGTSGGEAFAGEGKLAREEEREKPRHAERAIVAGYIRDILETAERLAGRPGDPSRPLVLGMVGHPNVGKSSIINALKGEKVVSTSLTPGHTKHLQHIPLSDSLQLLDCPGLTFPVTNLPREVQTVMGTFPISQSRELYTAVAYLAARLPLERIYGLQKPRCSDADEPWSGWTICEAYAEKKGYFIARGRGVPDTHRAAQHIVREALSGQLVVFLRPPPLSRAGEVAQIDSLEGASEGEESGESDAQEGDGVEGVAEGTGQDTPEETAESAPTAGRGQRGRKPRSRNVQRAKAGRQRDSSEEDTQQGGASRGGGYHAPPKDSLSAQLAALGGLGDSDADEPPAELKTGRSLRGRRRQPRM